MVENAIKSYRRRNGLTLQQFAERIGVTKATVWKYENAVRPPSIETAIAISKATDGEIRLEDLRPAIAQAVRDELERRPA